MMDSPAALIKLPAPPSEIIEWILSAIKSAGCRKSRPDYPLVCDLVRRKHQLPSRITKNFLDKMVEDKILRAVHYKGATSYRIVEEQTPAVRPKRQAALKMAAKMKVMTAQLSGSSSVCDVGVDNDNSGGDAALNSNNRNHTAQVSVKEEGEGSASSTVEMRHSCDKCHLSEAGADRLLYCSSCHFKAHPRCMCYTDTLAQVCYLQKHWQCGDCKRCEVCQEITNEESLLFCDACDKAYHLKCHVPKLEHVPSDDVPWICYSCTTTTTASTTTTTTTAITTTAITTTTTTTTAITTTTTTTPAITTTTTTNPAITTTTTTTTGGEIKVENTDASSTAAAVDSDPVCTCPETSSNPVKLRASSWTSSDVSAFWARAGFQQMADVCRDKDIDGPLLTTLDLDTLLALGIGHLPALSIVNRLRLLAMDRQEETPWHLQQLWREVRALVLVKQEPE